jgi:hypothetical protein
LATAAFTSVDLIFAVLRYKDQQYLWMQINNLIPFREIKHCLKEKKMNQIHPRNALTYVGLICTVLICSGLSLAEIDPGAAVGLWLFNGNVSDSSGNENNGELMNGAVIAAGGKFGQALSLDGDDDYVLVPTSASLDSTGENYTGVAWINFERKGGPAPAACCQDDQMVIAFSTNWHNILNVFGRGGRAVVGAVEVGSAELNPRWLSGPTPVDDDQWHHIGFTYDGATKVVYVDGEVDIDQPTTGVFGVAGIDVLIGGTPTGERPSNGLIDEVGIFNVPLAQEEIQQIMNDGLASIVGVPTTSVNPTGKVTTAWARIKAQQF